MVIGMKKQLTCKEVEATIPEFIKDELKYESLVSFIEHIETCEECREEMTIQYLILTGIKRLEDGETFDLKKELSVKIEESKHKVKHQKFMKCMRITMEVIALIAIIGIAIFIILL